MFPICPKCYRLHSRFRTGETKKQELLEERLEAIKRNRDREDEKLLRLMKKNMEKSNSTTTGYIPLDIQIANLPEEE